MSATWIGAGVSMFSIKFQVYKFRKAEFLKQKLPGCLHLSCVCDYTLLISLAAPYAYTDTSCC